MNHFKLFWLAVIAIAAVACQTQDNIFPVTPAGIAGKVTVCAEMPTGEASTRTAMDNYKNAANYDAFRLFWQEGDVIEGIAWQGDDAACWENAKALSIPALTDDNLTDEGKKATFTFDIPDGFDASQPLKIALFYVRDVNNDDYSDTYKNNPISFSITNKGVTWHNAQIAKAVKPADLWDSPNHTYLTNRTPMTARLEIASGWQQAGVSVSAPFRHLTTLFGFKIYNASDADLNLTELGLTVSDNTKKMFLTDGAVIDPISGNAVPDTNKAAATAITGITDNTIAAASAYTYYLPCVITGDMTGVEYSFKVNGQSAVVKTGKNYKPGVCYSIDIKWDGSAFSLLDHSQSMMFSYELSPDGKTLMRWKGDETFIDMNADPRLAEVTTIGGYDDEDFGWPTHFGAFSSNRTVKKIIIGNKVTTIETEAFMAFEGSEEIHIPASVTTIEENAFRWTSGAFTVDPANPAYSSEDGVLFDKNKTRLISFPEFRTGDYTIPSTVEEIAPYAFSSCWLTSVSYPASLKTVGESAFYYAKKITAADFSSCTQLTTLENDAFASCDGLQSASLPASLTTLGSSVFSYCPELTSVTFASPSSLTSIGESAFNGCSKLTSLDIPASVTDLGYCNTFAGCRALTEMTLPEGIVKIPRSAFWGCTGLQRVTIPSTVTDIDESAFMRCTALQAIYAKGATPPRLNGTSVFNNVPFPTCTLYLISTEAQAAYNAYPGEGGYSNASKWSSFTNQAIFTP